jgi:hypothetical protein
MEGIEDSTLDIVFSIIDEIGEAVFKETGSLAAKKVCAMIIATIMQRLADIEEIHTEL